MPNSRTLALTALAMLAFAGNSVLCRLALTTTTIDAASFSLVRILAGAVFLLLLVVPLRGLTAARRGSWPAALALLAYAWWFSLAYRGLPAGAGALFLFGAVQIGMLSYALVRGARMAAWQWLGVACALAGFLWLLLPGLSAPPLGASLLMVAAGLAWAAYTLLGLDSPDPLGSTAGNFARAGVLAVALYLLGGVHADMDPAGVAYAVGSGALASGAGYAIWYAALRALPATTAATVQLSVPLLAAGAGVLFLNEPLNLRLLAAAALILGGILLVLRGGRAKCTTAQA